MKRKLTSCLLVAGFMLATAPSAFATTYFIKVDGSMHEPIKGTKNPQKMLQTGIPFKIGRASCRERV